MFTICSVCFCCFVGCFFIPKQRFLKKIRGAPFAVLFSKTYTLNIFSFDSFPFRTKRFSLYTHTHTPLIVVLLRLRALLQRASNFGGEKSEWCGRALFYAALNFDHLPFITRTKQERISFLPQGGLVWGTTNFSLLLF
mgnify:CR=1 FL=1